MPGKLISLYGGALKCAVSSNVCRCLGVYLVSGRTFKCSFSNCKSPLFRAFNAMYGKIGRAASEETILELHANMYLLCLINSRF